ncbi:MAG: ArsR/SmtB family transcription factor [Oceanococcaceae bacterium]
MTPHLSDTAELLRVLAEPTRLRLALVLSRYSLTVAELTELTGLAQSRVSSHLARMRRLNLLQEVRQGASSLQALRSNLQGPARDLLPMLQQHVAGEAMQRDWEAAQALIDRRERHPGWAARVAGEMEKHYSPGRGWEVMTRALVPMLQLGSVLDIAAGDGVIAELLFPHAQAVTCVEIDPTVAQAGRRRLQRAGASNALYLQADMHALPFAGGSFDSVLLLNALTYSAEPDQVVAEAARMLRPGGQLCLSTLDQHNHAASVAPYDHCNNGFARGELVRLLESNGLSVSSAHPLPIPETRPPFHHVHVLHATRPHAGHTD